MKDIMAQKKGMTVREALKLTEKKLLEARTEEAPVEARWILAEVLGVKMFEVFMSPLRELTRCETKKLSEIIERRARREPLAYILGYSDFRGLKIKVKEGILIPRPETELLVDEALMVMNKGRGTQRVIEPCTGSGCVSVALAREFEKVHIIAIDISAEALELAHDNAIINGVDKKISFLRTDLLLPFKRHAAFDLIAANPPYIPCHDIKTLAPEIRLYEPVIALDGGSDGLDCIKEIINSSAGLLKQGGSLLLEIGMGQSGEVTELARATGLFDNVRLIKDLSGIERIFSAQKKKTS